MLRRCELCCKLNTKISRTKELIVTHSRGTTGWFFYHKLLHHVKRIQKVKIPQTLCLYCLFVQHERQDRRERVGQTAVLSGITIQQRALLCFISPQYETTEAEMVDTALCVDTVERY